MSSTEGKINWLSGASTTSGSSSGTSGRVRATYGSRIPGGSKRNLLPTEDRRDRRKPGSVSATEKKHEAVRMEASSTGSVTRYRHLTRYISELGESEGHTYVLTDKSTLFSHFACNRGTRDRRTTPKFLNIPEDRVKAIGCPVRLKAYCFDLPILPESPVFVLTRGEHNHPPGSLK